PAERRPGAAVGIAQHRSDDGRRQRVALSRGPVGVELEALVTGPAVVGADVLAGVSEVDLLVAALAYVADDEVPGGAVEREAPGVAQAVGPDLGTVGAAVGAARALLLAGIERVAGGDRVGRGPRRDPQQLAEQPVGVLGVELGV